MTNYSIRVLKESDREEWEVLWRAYHAFYETVIDDPVYDLAWQRLLGTDPHEFNGFVAIEPSNEKGGKEKIIGLVHYLFHRHGWKVQPVCYLQDLFVLPEIRKSGIGRMLIESVYDAADRANAPDVYWLTQDFNTAGRKLYDKIGHLTPFIKYSR